MSRNADRIIRDRDRALKTLERLSDPLIADLVRRAGTRATTDPEKTGGRGRAGKGTHSDPTLLSVVRSMAGKVPDPVFDATRELAQIVNEMAKLALRADDKVRFVLDVKERAKEAEITYCKMVVEGGCGREVMNTPNDRLRSGFCGACYVRRLRAQKGPDGFYIQVTQ